MVVVAGELFCYQLDSGGAEQLTRIGSADALVPSTAAYQTNRVPIVSEDSLDQILAPFTVAVQQFLSTVLEDASGLQEIAEGALKTAQMPAASGNPP